MIQRFHIEDLIAQDTTGVIFRALDTETGRPVAVRRFFPFGASGGGLQPDEQDAYRLAVDRLAGLSHLALRSVIGGGCDPVDGMPFLATEWIEGDSILEFLTQGPMPAEFAIELIDQALEVSELLSRELDEEAVWVETALPMIIAGHESSGRRFTFWICPLKWLGAHQKSRGLTSIITLTEEIMGWKGLRVKDHAGQGLGGWLKWLRLASATATLRETREKLAVSVAEAAAAAAQHLAAQAIRPPPQKTRSQNSKFLWLINFTLLAVAAGLGVWWLQIKRLREMDAPVPDNASWFAAWMHHDAGQAAPAAVPVPAPAEEVDEADDEAPVASASKDPPVPAENNPGVIPWTNRDLLMANGRREVTVEGVLADITFSRNKKTLYLLFTKEEDPAAACGAVVLKNASPDLSEKALKPLIGQTLRVRGVVRLPKVGHPRPEIQIKDRAAIQMVK